MAAQGGASGGELAAYVPRALWAPRLAPWWEVEGSILLADLSGFTRLSELLARQGKQGAEELVNAMNTTFTALLSATDDGGDLLKFGGDALLILYTGEDHARRACHAATGMRAALRRIARIETPAGQVSLKMSVGVNSDRFTMVLAGEEHVELVVAGPAATRTTELESAAEAGEVLISAATADAVAASAALEPGRAGGTLLRRMQTIPRVADAFQAPASVTIERFLPPALRDRVGVGLDGEHRHVTMAFVHAGGIDGVLDEEGPDALADHIGAVVRSAQDAARSFGVNLLGTDIAPDGVKLLLVAGAPDGSEDDEARMLLAARGIVDAATGPLKVRVGVNRGHVFAGDVGAPFRRTYTLMGDAVNLAARLMSAAEQGQVLAQVDVVERATAGFDVEAVPPFLVKGKSEPVRAYRVGAARRGRRRASAGGLAFIGRETELATLRRALSTARRGAGSVIEVVGDAGLGKSRLVAEALAGADGVARLTVSGEPLRAGIPYGALRDLLRALLRLDPDAGPETTVAQLTGVVHKLVPDAAPWLPLLGVALDVEIPTTDEVEALAPQYRALRMAETVGRLLTDVVVQPVVVVLEDAFWFDQASADVFVPLLRNIAARSWLVVVTRRPEPEGLRADLGYTADVLTLAPLTPAEATRLASGADAPPGSRDAVVARSGGNPLFLMELATAAARGASVDDLPDTVEAIVTSRLDRLPDADRRALRYASVLGASFTPELVDLTLGDLGVTSSAPVWSRVSELVGRDRDGTFRFLHDLFRVAAYEGLTYRRRRDLHGRVGDVLAAQWPAPSGEQAAVLSLHFLRARRWAETWRFGVMAGRAAQSAYANADAAELYERAVEAARFLPDVGAGEIGEVMRNRGDTLELAGRYDDARACYAGAQRRIAAPLDRAALVASIAVVEERRGRYAAALRAHRSALSAAAECGDGGQSLHARAWIGMAGIRYRTGNMRRAIADALEGVAQAEACGDLDSLAHAYYLLEAAYATLADPRARQYRDLALPLYEATGNLVGQSRVCNNLGVTAYFEGRWSDSLEWYERSRDACEKAGDVMGQARAINNIGETKSDQGHLEEAEALFREALAVWRWSGYPLGVALAVSNLGLVALRSGRFDDARELLSEAQRSFEQLGSELFVAETRARLSQVLMAEGRPGEALVEAASILALPVLRGDPTPLHAALHRIRGQALADTAQRDRAVECMQESVAAAEACDAAHERALSLAELGRLRGDDGLIAEARVALSGLGVLVA